MLKNTRKTSKPTLSLKTEQVRILTAAELVAVGGGACTDDTCRPMTVPPTTWITTTR